MDRRLCAGAAIAVTVVIAGANALPALLLGPPAAEPTIGAAAVQPLDAPPELAAPALTSTQLSASPVTKAEPAPAATAAAPQPAPGVTAALPQPVPPPGSA